MIHRGCLIAVFSAATVGCGGAGETPDAPKITYSEAVQKYAEQQRELTRLQAAREKQVADYKRLVDGPQASDRPPGHFKLNASPQDTPKLEDLRLDLGQAQQEARREQDAAQSALLERFDAEIAKQRELVEAAKALKDSIDN